jgi:hypothetical protein
MRDGNPASKKAPAVNPRKTNQGIEKGWRLLGIALVAAVATVVAASGQNNGGQNKGSQLTEVWRLAEPAVYENISVFPVVARKSAETTVFETLDEALLSGEALVTERGSDILRRTRDGQPMHENVPMSERMPQSGASVNELVLVNRGKKPLILLAGEMVSGGKQDRIIAKDRIVPVGAEPLPLDVFCVEHGRWTTGSGFTAAKTMVHPSVREKAAVDQAQQQVWDAVRVGSTSASVTVSSGEVIAGGGNGAPVAPPVISGRALETMGATMAPTGDYQQLYNNSKVNQDVNPFVDEVQRRFARATDNLKGERVIGVVIAYGGEVAWSDIFASPELFERYWPKLLRSYVVEALARPRTKEQATMAEAQDFLKPLRGPEKVESTPDVYRWREVTQGHYAEIELQALKPEDMLLHQMKIHRTS